MDILPSSNYPKVFAQRSSKPKIQLLATRIRHDPPGFVNEYNTWGVILKLT
jgi:hypothetical protein